MEEYSFGKFVQPAVIIAKSKRLWFVGWFVGLEAHQVLRQFVPIYY
jgi:hypothetical protein